MDAGSSALDFCFCLLKSWWIIQSYHYFAVFLKAIKLLDLFFREKQRGVGRERLAVYNPSHLVFFQNAARRKNFYLLSDRDKFFVVNQTDQRVGNRKAKNRLLRLAGAHKIALYDLLPKFRHFIFLKNLNANRLIWVDKFFFVTDADQCRAPHTPGRYVLNRLQDRRNFVEILDRQLVFLGGRDYQMPDTVNRPLLEHITETIQHAG